jgi:hypothetical protein
MGRRSALNVKNSRSHLGQTLIESLPGRRAIFQNIEEQIMGNRDARGREKKKPKKKDIKEISRPVGRPAPAYKPATPAAPTYVNPTPGAKS